MACSSNSFPSPLLLYLFLLLLLLILLLLIRSFSPWLLPSRCHLLRSTTRQSSSARLSFRDSDGSDGISSSSHCSGRNTTFVYPIPFPYSIPFIPSILSHFIPFHPSLQSIPSRPEHPQLNSTTVYVLHLIPAEEAQRTIAYRALRSIAPRFRGRKLIAPMVVTSAAEGMQRNMHHSRSLELPSSAAPKTGAKPEA